MEEENNEDESDDEHNKTLEKEDYPDPTPESGSGVPDYLFESGRGNPKTPTKKIREEPDPNTPNRKIKEESEQL